MIITVAINDEIFRIFSINKIPAVGKKPCGKKYDTNRNIGTMDMFKYE